MHYPERVLKPRVIGARKDLVCKSQLGYSSESLHHHGIENEDKFSFDLYWPVNWILDYLVLFRKFFVGTAFLLSFHANFVDVGF